MRINIEDKLYLDPRFKALTRKLGCEYKAIGMLVCFWRLALTHWSNNKSLISENSFRLSGLDEVLFEVEFAVRTSDGIYAKGSEKNFEWFLKLKASNSRAGKKSAEARKKKFGSAVPKNARNNIIDLTEHRPNTPPNETERSLSYSLSLSKKEKKEELKESPNGDIPVFISVYVKAFKSRYGDTRPDLGGKVRGQIKNLIKDVGLNRACDLIQVFLQMEDPWFITKCHDFTTFMTNVQKIGIALDTGKKDPSKKELNWDYIYGGEKDATN